MSENYDIDRIQGGLRRLHEDLMQESALYRACYRLKLVSLMIALQQQAARAAGEGS